MEDVRDGSPGSVTVDASSAVEVVVRSRSVARSPGPDQIGDANLDREINAPIAARVAVESNRFAVSGNGHSEEGLDTRRPFEEAIRANACDTISQR